MNNLVTLNKIWWVTQLSLIQMVVCCSATGRLIYTRLNFTANGANKTIHVHIKLTVSTAMHKSILQEKQL